MTRKNRKRKSKPKSAVSKEISKATVNLKSNVRDASSRKPRVLWANSFCLLDTSSGASISIRQILKQLHKSGYEVRIVGATIFDSPHGTKGLGQEWQDAKSLDVKFVDVKDGNLSHRLVRTQSTKRSEMSLSENDFLYSAYVNELNNFKPDVVFFYGGQPLDFLISHEARVRGIPSAAYLVNANYKGTRWCRDVDLIVTDTHATSAMYAAREGIEPVPVGKFIDLGKVIAPDHKRHYATLINPSWAKGAGIVAMLAVLLEERRPDIVFEVVESRGSWSEVVRNVTRSVWGVERSELSNVIVTPNTDNISEVYGQSRIVLGLSQWWESGSRVLAEAMLNGIPAMVSNHGGSPEMVGEGGIVVDLPPSCHEAPYNSMPRPELLDELVHFLERVWDDEPFYLNLMVRALQQGNKLHRMEVSTQRLLEAFQPLVEKRAGDGDFFDAVKRVHKHGLIESSSFLHRPAPEINKFGIKESISKHRFAVEVVKLNKSVTFLFSSAMDIANGTPVKVLFGSLEEQCFSTEFVEFAGHHKVTAFTTEVIKPTSQLDGYNCELRSITELEECLSKNGMFKSCEFLKHITACVQNFVSQKSSNSENVFGSERNFKKVGFILFGSMLAASSRLQGQFISEWLNKSGRYRAVILHRPESRYQVDMPDERIAPIAWAAIMGTCETVVFQKANGKSHQHLMEIFKKLGIRIIFVDCDLRQDYNFLNFIDHVIVPSEFLANEYRKTDFEQISVIPDMIDFRRSLPVRKHAPATRYGVWIGTSDKFEYFSSLRDSILEIIPSVKITSISDHPEADIKWQLDIFPEVLGGFDFGFITLASDEWSMAKSSNRAVLLMANGLPTLAENRETYANVIQHGETGFLFETPRDVINALQVLDDPTVWVKIAAAGADRAHNEFGADRIGSMWEEVLTCR
ncbi:glycosyltransferase [Lacimonas salitolerans]|uniref:Glycosyltransferase n=1 Tax=Lacimonas salitolerans TaxID=1323750 RepID=A0ABW4EGI7_9RHOB